MIKSPRRRISPSDLESLIDTLDVHFVALAECLVSPGYRLTIGGNPAPGIHYNLVGRGRIYICDNPAIELHPHTLIIVPTNCPYAIEVDAKRGGKSALKSVDGASRMVVKDGIQRYVAGSGAPQIMLICGFFRALYGQTIELFRTLQSPIAEQFDASHQLDTKLKAAMAELVAQEVGSKAMSSALLKQIIVALLRRSLTSLDHWAERFAILRDPKIARAFAEMAANPGAPHTVKSLAARACLSRSAFMGRFVALVGSTPMAVLRELRMRQAARQLRLNESSVERVGQAAGYTSRIAFSRAFRKAFGCDPSDYRDRMKPEVPIRGSVEI
jgi:AraC family transcriptional activator of mtrCDE